MGSDCAEAVRSKRRVLESRLYTSSLTFATIVSFLAFRLDALTQPRRLLTGKGVQSCQREQRKKKFSRRLVLM